MNRSLALAAAALCAFACGKQTFLVAAFVQTPALPNPEDPNGTIPQLQVMTAYFGTIDTTSPTKIDASAEAPITDATANVSFNHAGKGGSDVDEPRVLPLPAVSATPGTYALSSTDEKRLTFEVGVPYTLVLQTAGADGEAYGARFTPAPPGDIQEFAAPTAKCHVTLPAPLSGTYDAPRCLDHAVATPLTLSRTDLPAAGADPLPAFVLVGRIDPQNPGAEPAITFKTVPDSADKLLKYVLSDRDYRKTSFVVDASGFPQSGYYIVSLLVVKQGKVSGNAFLGSTALAASGSAGIVHVP
jgi:hypothetical protein